MALPVRLPGTHTTKQVDGHRGLLDTTRDFFHFVTKFFEVTSISATHIYHSALELSPPSSIVRRLYHHQRITSSPRLAIGTPRSWSQSVAITNKDYIYGSCTWSPCGRFIATQTHEAVEVRDPLTSELLSNLQSTKHTHQLTGPLAYSSDGCSLCCASSTSIIIWDIQTGGIVREVECDATLSSPNLLVWSLDGKTIGAVHGRSYTRTVTMYGVASGGILSHNTLGSRDEPYLWAHDKSFQIMGTSLDHRSYTWKIDILEVGPTLTQVRSFSIPVQWSPKWFHIKSFSPISHHFSISAPSGIGQLLVLDAQNPAGHLLEYNGLSNSHCFSSDGKLFGAYFYGDFNVWEYNHAPNPIYTLWKKFPGQSWSPNKTCPQFSPTSLSILGILGGVFQVWYLDDHSTCIASSEPYTLVPPHATYIVTAHLQESIVTITNCISRTTSQFINAGTTILGFALTGNVLLVVGLDIIVAWRITDGGTVDGVFDDRVADPSDSIWTISPEPPLQGNQGSAPLELPIAAQVGSIALDRILIHIYHSGTGETPKDTLEFDHGFNPWYNLKVTSQGQYYLSWDELNQTNNPSEDNGLTPQTAFQEGWVKDPEGRHLLWLPVEWRIVEGCVKLFYYFATLQLELPGDLNAAMF